MKSPPPLILASTSIYRRELLSRLKIPFTTQAPGVDESRDSMESALQLVVRLASSKAAAVASQHPHACVIGSDQVALLETTSGEEFILGKPGSVERCIEQLQRCSGRTIQFLTAVCVQRGAEAAFDFVDITRVTYRNLDAPTIARYVDREAPLDCAGSFKSEALGITLCESIDSADPTALIGLPLIRLSAALRAVGYALP